MPETVILYHNNRCSKSRAALSLLQLRGLKTKVVHYLDTPPDAGELEQLYRRLKLDSPRGMMRTKDALYRELALDNPALSDEALIAAMAAEADAQVWIERVGRGDECSVVIEDGQIVETRGAVAPGEAA